MTFNVVLGLSNGDGTSACSVWEPGAFGAFVGTKGQGRLGGCDLIIRTIITLQEGMFLFRYMVLRCNYELD